MHTLITDWSKLSDTDIAVIKAYIKTGNKTMSYESVFFPQGWQGERKKLSKKATLFFDKKRIREVMNKIHAKAVSEMHLSLGELEARDAQRRAQLEEQIEAAKITKAWVLKRAALLADFNIVKFIKIDGGDAYYDFSQASDDDWYCIQEYSADIVMAKIAAAEGELIPVSKIKLKSFDKLRALDMVGKHIDVRAFEDAIKPEATKPPRIESDMDAKQASRAYQDLLASMKESL